MIDYEQFKKKALSDPSVMKEYEAYKAEFSIARALIKARMSAKMTQADVAKKMLTSQTQIARMESGHHLPSLQSISKYAHAINRSIKIELQP